MADTRTVEFFKIVLLRRASKQEISHTAIQQILSTVISKYGIETGDGSQAVDLTPDKLPEDIEPKIIMDVYEYEERLFARICKKKPNNTLVQRDYLSLRTKDVLSEQELREKGIEVFTYLSLDYQHGILSIVSSRDAPGARVLNWIFEHYSKAYTLDFINIPNADGIRAVYDAGRPSITAYEFVIPTPDARFLQDVLRMDEDEIANIVNERVTTATLILKPEPYHSIENGTYRVRKAIDTLLGKKENYIKVKMKAKSDNFSTKEFDLHAKFFSYPITVRKYKQENGRKVEVTINELRDQYLAEIDKAYEENKDLILAIACREDN